MTVRSLRIFVWFVVILIIGGVGLLAVLRDNPVTVSSGEAVDWRTIPLPDLQATSLKLNVAQVVNPRFARLSDEQLREILARTQRLMQTHFNVSPRFKLRDDINIDDFFLLLPAAVRDQRRDEIIDPVHITEQQKQAMRMSLLHSMQDAQTPERQLIEYARPYLLSSAKVEDLPQLSAAVIDTMLSRLQSWYAYNAEDGRPVLGRRPYHQWVWWDSLGYGELPVDVVITNQLVASAENYDQQLHACLRGGISGGTMTFSRNRRFRGYVFVSTYALLNRNKLLAPLTDGDYDEQEILDYTAATLAHELGHLLFHYGHPFGVPACIMAPTPLLHYRSWYQGLDAAACRAADHPQMQPGAARITFNPAW